MLYSLTILFRRIYPCSPLFGKDIYGGRTINSPVSLSNDLNLSEDITDPTVVILWKTLLKTPFCLQCTNIGDFNPVHMYMLSPTYYFHALQRQCRPWWVRPTGIRFCTASMISHFTNMLPTLFSVLILPLAIHIHLRMYTLHWLS